MSYQYNSLNQRKQMVADGRTVNYTYDSGNRLYQVLSPNPVATITYDLAGRRQTLSYPNLVTTTYTPNRTGFLTNLLTRYNQQTTINSFAYTPDGMSNRTSMTDLAGQHGYTYDDTYQLTQATHPNMPTEQFTYDPVGNRLTSVGQAPAAGRTTEFVYDFENRLIEVNYTGMQAQYKYDPFGRRIEKVVDNGTPVTTRYFYDGPNIVTEYDGSWNVTAKYVHTLDIDDPLTVTQGASTYYYHRDGLGSVVNLTDSSGSNVKTYTYKSFGGIYSETGALTQPFTFTGREYDPESGLYFYRARYYDPRAGRFLTKDPIGFQSGNVNLYRAMGNNPINFIDPFGLYESPCYLGWVPGQQLYDLGVTALESENYSLATLYFAGMAGEQILFALTLGQSISPRAALSCEIRKGGKLSKQAGNPFKGKTAEEIDEMFVKKGFNPRGPDPIQGKGGYVNPSTGRSYHIDPGGQWKRGLEGPHVDVNRPPWSGLPKRKYPLE